MRTQGQVNGDTGYGDGQIFISALDFAATSGTVTATRNAAGSFSLNIGNSQTAVLSASLSSIIFRYGLQDWLQEQFGSSQAGGAQGYPVGGYTTLSVGSTAAASPANIAVLNSANFTVGRSVNAGGQLTKITAIPDATHITVASLATTLAASSVVTENLFTTPAGVTGPPPFTGVTQLTPLTAPRPKGIKIREIYPVYAIAGAALTLNTVGLTKTVFAPNVAPVVTNLLADAANGLATATNAQPYITPIQIASPAYQVTKYASYNIEWDVTTAGGGTAQIFGVFVDVEYNYV